MDEPAATPQFEAAARRFMLPFVFLLVACWLLLALGTLFLSRTGELRPVTDVVARQLRDGGLYGEALRDNRRAYKLALYQAIKPQVVAIGSSRVQEFRGDFFRVPFANLSGGILTFDEADSFIGAMLARGAAPKIAIMAVDWWWFDTRREQSSQRMGYDGKAESDITLADRLLPARWLAQKKFSAGNMTRALAGVRADVFGPPQGALAAMTHTGFRADGAWLWTNAATAAPAQPAPEFIPAPAPPGQLIVDAPKLARLAALVRRLQSHGVRVVLFIPPEMSQVVTMHRDHPQAFPAFTEIRATLAQIGAPWFDFQDAGALGSSDCEFFDSEHAGDVLGVRMLQAMAAEPSTGLAPLTDAARLSQVVTAEKGHAILLTPQQKLLTPERDFLGLGCPK